ncbi:Prefoldin subunit 4 [Trametes coccinea BRFM310]|uniref:Prefoldin subunit 4 n=1 Tax=Trametes coccinea (strain BRFM310) TaxID=1353009 RepID=A0A1Y2J0T8_TRAC3|nr:Prefoldin subunit 4 [Trametes coccinea BRFM310]
MSLEIPAKLCTRLSRPPPSSCVWQLSQEEEHEDSAEVTWEDQQRINSFSKLNTRLRGIEEKIQELKQEKEALDDISMELELADEDEPVMYRIGEAFIHMPHARAVKKLERDLAALNAELEKQTSNAEDCEKQMKELKVILYAKFGRAINLDE